MHYIFDNFFNLNFSQVRESFMRQFVYEVEDDENEGIKRISETFDSKMVYRKQRPVQILNKPPKVRTVETSFKKAAVTYIIK